MTKHFAIAILAALWCAAPVSAVGPTIDIVVADKAEPLEKFAAEELAGQWKKLFDANVRIAATVPSDASSVVLVGTQASHSDLDEFKAKGIKLSEHGFAIQNVKLNDKPALAVIGGSPRAVLWAVYEIGWLQGIRYFPTLGDVYPTSAPEFSLTKLGGVIDDPDHPVADARLDDVSPLGHGAWSLDEFRARLRQLAKYKVEVLHLNAREWNQGLAYAGPRISVTGDTAGKAAFRGAKFFDNPEWASESGDEGRRQAAKKLLDEVAAEALKLGIRLKLTEDAGRAPSMLPTMSDLRTAVYARNSVVRPDTAPKFVEAVIDPICGAEVAPRVFMALQLQESAASLVEKHDASLGQYDSKMLLKHYDSAEPPPAWWGEVRTNYLNAMNEMYRANTRAREGGRAFTLYYARRFEFGFEYMNVVEAIRNAGIAKKKGDKETQIAELEKAIDSVTNACNATAAVARSQSDRGVIAVMNEYGYRPLLKLLDEADAEN